jgi:hypothetical protein
MTDEAPKLGGFFRFPFPGSGVRLIQCRVLHYCLKSRAQARQLTSEPSRESSSTRPEMRASSIPSDFEQPSAAQPSARISHPEPFSGSRHEMDHHAHDTWSSGRHRAPPSYIRARSLRSLTTGRLLGRGKITECVSLPYNWWMVVSETDGRMSGRVPMRPGLAVA